MSTGSILFNAVWTTLSEARASLRIGRKEISRCLCGAIGTTRAASDEGMFNDTDPSVKFVATEANAALCKEGASVEMKRSSESDWNPYTISGRSETAGLIALQLEAEFAE